MQEVAINVPFESGEIIQIVADELKSRMSKLSPLQGSKEYTSFSVDFQVKIKLRRSGEAVHEARETLAWGNVEKGGLPSAADLDAVAAEMVAAEETSHFDSKDPNDERLSRDMPLVIEASDGRGGKTRRKVRVKG